MYCYKPLQATTSFRLVHIVPGTGDDALRLNITEEDLESAGDYQALSYEWQGKTGTCPIAVADEEFLVTPNLYAALQMLRVKPESRRIWIDAICINQCDLDERSNQVAKMREIYEGASQVIVWIGTELDGTQAAFNILERFCHFAVQRHEADPEIGSRDPYGREPVLEDIPQAEKTALAELDDENLSASIKDILSRSYSERVWVIQEIAVSSNAIVYCGSCSLPFVAMWTAARYIYHTRSLGDRFHDTKIPNILGIFSCCGFLSTNWSGLFPMLQMFRNVKASDPRDKVYGLRGLIPKFWKKDEPIVLPTVNYKHSVERVYQETAVYLILTTRSLDLLKACARSAAHEEGKLPSWVPDWRIRGPAIPVTREFALASKFPQIVPLQFGQENSDTGLPAALLLQTNILDTADWFNLTPGADNALQCSYELLNMVGEMRSEYVTGGSARVALWKAMIADSIYALPAPEDLAYSFVQFSYVIGYGKLNTPVDDIVGNDFANDPNPLLRFLH